MSQQVIDIHCHPALKTWLFPHHHVYDEKMPHGFEFSENCFVNIRMMEAGHVGIAVSVYYLPEEALKKLKIPNIIDEVLRTLLLTLCDLSGIIEDTSSPSKPFVQIKKYIAVFEDDVKYAREVLNENVDIARNYADLQDKISNKGTTMFLHSIEGAHALGCGEITFEEMSANLDELVGLGLCQLTVGHFFENILVSSSGGIPPKLAGQIGYDPLKQISYPLGYNGDLAIRMVDRMLDLGIVLDLVHCHELAKQMIFNRNNLRGTKKRPLVFAHTGVREVALKHHPGMLSEYAAYLPDATDIAKIKDCNGVLGVIFMDYWLTGDDNTDPAINAVVETMIYIRDAFDSQGKNGTYDHIAIGSDLDGFTTVPRDLGGSRMMTDLVDAIARIPGITADEIDQICWGNYMRVLKNGWGKMA